MRADKEMGYFMTDSSTFYVKKAKIRNLEILFRGDPILVNVYHALVASPDRYPQANYDLAIKFVRCLSSPEGQRILREYGKAKYGSALYNNAEYAKQRED
jgi:tungstate transport system substrate-binding protein